MQWMVGSGLRKKKFRYSNTDTYEQLVALVSESSAVNESCTAGE